MSTTGLQTKNSALSRRRAGSASCQISQTDAAKHIAARSFNPSKWVVRFVANCVNSRPTNHQIGP